MITFSRPLSRSTALRHLFFLFACFSLLVGLNTSFTPPVACAQDGSAFRPASRNNVRIVLVPEKNAFVLRSQFKPLADFLAQKTGRMMYLEVASDYEAAVQAFVDHEADIGFLGGNSYLLARERAEVEPLMRPVWPAQKSICRSYIFVREADGIRELQGMKGKRLAVVDSNSLTGFNFAYCFFANSGVPKLKDFFSKIIWCGSHDTSVWAVVTGEADIGVAKSRVYDDLSREYPEEMGKLLVLGRSAELPSLCCVASRDISESDKERLIFLLSQMDKTEDGKRALAALGAVSFERAYDADYNVLRQALARERCSVSVKEGDSSATSH